MSYNRYLYCHVSNSTSVLNLSPAYAPLNRLKFSRVRGDGHLLLSTTRARVSNRSVSIGWRVNDAVEVERSC